jgi:hypothetical protein
MRIRIDEKGKKYGKLLVLFEAAKTDSTRQARWFCRCECGTTTIVVGTDLRRGASQSCGCLRIGRIRRAYVKKRKPRGNALDMFDEDIL